MKKINKLYNVLTLKKQKKVKISINQQKQSTLKIP